MKTLHKAALPPTHIEVTVVARLPLAKVEQDYTRALTPDGGYVGTLNAYIRLTADGLEASMRNGYLDAEYESSWRLA